jgi:N-acyl homoserine lactone hydrolase
VKDGEAQIVLAGDASYLEVTMLSETFDGKSERVNSEGTLARIRELCSVRPTICLPTHDPKSGDRLSERRLTSVPR